MKYRYFERYLKPKTFIYITFFVGFLIGIFLSFLFREDEAQEIVWLNNILQYIKYGEIHYGDMFLYVLKRRIMMIAIIILFCISGRGKYFLVGGIGLAGGFCGFYITEFVVAKGIFGSILFAVSIFPHYLCYAYGYICLLHWILKISKKQNIINRDGQKEKHFSDINTKDLIKKLAPMAVVIMGILLECYVNPLILKIFLKIFM